MSNKRSDLDFMSELDAVTKLRPSWEANAILYIVSCLVIFIVMWANFAKLEIITRGEGSVVPSSEIQLVQSLEGGILSELRVSEGEMVKKGQVLARIENVAFASEERGIEAQSLALTLKQLRLNAEINDKKFMIEESLQEKNIRLANNEIALYKSRQNGLKKILAVADNTIKKNEANLKEIKATIQRFRDSRRLLSKQFKITTTLVAKNAMPKLEAIKQERELSDLSGNLNAAVERQGALEADLASSINTKSAQEFDFKSKSLAELSEVETKLSSIRESLKTAGDRVDRTELRAPTDGIIKVINQKTIGGIVEPAMKLMEIVPLDDDLKITAKIEPADIAFLEVGQEVNVKITAYDAQKFGSLRGVLKRISADTIEDRDGNIFFEIDVVTNKNYLGSVKNPLPIIPGMIAQTEVITGKRSVMSYLAKPFLRARDRAMTEQ